MNRFLVFFLLTISMILVSCNDGKSEERKKNEQMLQLIQAYLIEQQGATEKPCALISKSGDVYTAYISKTDVCTYPINQVNAYENAQALVDELISIYGSFGDCVEMQAVMQENKDLVASQISSKYKDGGKAVILGDGKEEAATSLENGLGYDVHDSKFSESQVNKAYLLTKNKAKVALAYIYAGDYQQVGCQTSISSSEDTALYMPDVITAVNANGSKPAFHEVKCQYGPGADTNALCTSLNDEF